MTTLKKKGESAESKKRTEEKKGKEVSEKRMLSYNKYLKRSNK